MIYSSSDIEYDTLKLVIMGHYPFTLPPKNPENQNFEKIKKKKKKNAGDIIILHKCTKNHDHMLYCF